MKIHISEYEDDGESAQWGTVEIAHEDGDVSLFGDLFFNQCCGVIELCHFSNSYLSIATKDECIKAFHEAIPLIGQKARKGVVHLTLNIYEGHELPVQRPWLVEAVETYPGAVSLPWVLNPNTGNQIKMFMLPTGAMEE